MYFGELFEDGILVECGICSSSTSLHYPSGFCIKLPIHI